MGFDLNLGCLLPIIHGQSPVNNSKKKKKRERERGREKVVNYHEIALVTETPFPGLCPALGGSQC